MENNQQLNKTATGAAIQKERQQNAASNPFGTEFADETGVQAIRQSNNRQASAKKSQNADQRQS